MESSFPVSNVSLKVHEKWGLRIWTMPRDTPENSWQSKTLTTVHRKEPKGQGISQAR
jgi:hypothetical protein